MGVHSIAVLAVCCGALAGWLGGCVERREKLVIDIDGSVESTVDMTADSFVEMYAGDAVPTIDGGWLVVEEQQVSDNGDDEYLLRAESFFPPDVELPASYEGPREPYPGANLQFPTRLIVERRRDGTFYHFARSYEARQWMQFNGPLEKLNEQIAALSDGDVAQLAPERQVQLLRLVAEVSTVKQRIFARRAFAEVMPDGPQDLWLTMRRGIHDVLQTIDYEVLLVELLAEEDGSERGALIQNMQEDLEDRVTLAIQHAIRGYGGHSVSLENALIDRYRWERRRFEITEDLADDAFEITVQMPGRIVAHNADRSAGNEVVWEFSGEMMRDRELELMVTSVVE